MKVTDLIPDGNHDCGTAILMMAKTLAKRVDELEELLDRECKQNEALDELLMAIGTEARLDTSTYIGKKYISLGYIREDNPHFAEIVDYFNLREEEKNARIPTEHQE